MSNEIYPKEIFYAMLAQQTNRNEEMIDYLQTYISTQLKEEISKNLRNLLYIAYKNHFNPLRNSLKVIIAYETKEKPKEISLYLPYIQEYKTKLETLLTNSFNNILNFIETVIKNNTINNNIENKIFFLKLKADFNRYMCEISQGELKEKVRGDALLFYQESYSISKDLYILNITKLGLVLNYIIFLYEVMNDIEQSIKIGNENLEKAKNEIENLENNESKNKEKNNELDDDINDIKELLSLIENNIITWKIELNEKENKK